jgi:hypothetical protein
MHLMQQDFLKSAAYAAATARSGGGQRSAHLQRRAHLLGQMPPPFCWHRWMQRSKQPLPCQTTDSLESDRSPAIAPPIIAAKQTPESRVRRATVASFVHKPLMRMRFSGQDGARSGVERHRTTLCLHARDASGRLRSDAIWAVRELCALERRDGRAARPDIARGSLTPPQLCPCMARSPATLISRTTSGRARSGLEASLKLG